MLHHFCNFTVLTLSPNAEMQETWRSVVPRYGLQYPFLMCQLLALGALHLGYLNPAQEEIYHHRATNMQNHAMAGFHTIELKIDETNCAVVMLFSMFVAIQVMADPAPTRHITAAGFIDHFVQCLKLMHGTRVLVIENWWESVQKFEDLKPLWKIREEDQTRGNCPPEVHKLSELAQNPSLSDSASQAYSEAIKSLIWQFSLARLEFKDHTTVRWGLAWPVMLKRDFLDHLDERRPEALIALSYYGVLLHSYRQSWIVRDTGKRLVNAVNEYLGARWADWTEWTIEKVNSRDDLDPMERQNESYTF
jgi:hypothetical protein